MGDTERNYEEVLRLIVEATAAKIGKDFFTSMVVYLSNIFDLKYAFIGERIPGQVDKIKTIAVCKDGEIQENFIYELANTPCAKVIRQEPCLHTSGVQAEFPKDDLLADLKVESYLGTPLFDSNGDVQGLLVLMDSEPFLDEIVLIAQPVLQIFAARSGAELSRINAERRLREREENLRITLNGIGDAVIATDEKTRVTQMNPVAETLTGWSFEEARGKPLHKVCTLVNADSHMPIGDVSSAILEADDLARAILEAPSPGEMGGETLLVSRNGTEHRIDESGSPIRDRDGNIVGTVLVFRDITEEYFLQERLRQSQKMEAIGELAGGIAHDFNNLLNGIIGSAELLRMDIPKGTEQAGDVENILQASKRAADLSKQFLAFSRKGALRNVEFDVHEIIHEVVDLLHRSIDPRIIISTELDAIRAIARGDPSQLQNALLNLGLNARDAMSEGGELVFSTRTVVLEVEYCQARGFEIHPGEHLEIQVTDTGAGMSSEVQQRIFEPFFTTKQVGEGTGLGLAGVYGCVKSFDGMIEVQSQVGRGSTFQILFPVSKSRSASVTETPSGTLIRGEGHILFVDDEEALRNFAKPFLESLGYTVSTCVDGVDAIGFFESHFKEIDLVILDLVMPRLSGEDTFRLMKNLAPDVRVLISSGFTRPKAIDALLEEGALAFLCKPFHIEELSDAVANHIK